MQTAYIYSASRVNTLSQFLLSKTDIERLLVADPGDDLQSALKETYLAPYVLRVPEENVSLAVEQTLIDAKRLVHKIAPDGDMFRVLWVQYDIHNLRVFAKAAVAGLSYDDCKQYVSQRGVYDPAYLYEQIEAHALDMLQAGWQAAYDEAVKSASDGNLEKLDGILDACYFATSQRIVDALGDKFMKSYLATLIDLYNLKSRLRHLKNEELHFVPDFIAGGTFAADQIETVEDVKNIIVRYGGVEYWKDAFEQYETEKNFTRIDARSAEYLIIHTKAAAADMFSSASLVLYYLKCRQSVANIRAIVVGKNSGLAVAEIRTNLRLAYVND